MIIQSVFFVLFLVSYTSLSTRSWAQTYSLQSKNEPAASQDAHWLGEEIQRNQPVVSEIQKGENHSRNAMHWTAVNTEQWKVARGNQQSEFFPTVSKQPIAIPLAAPSRFSSNKQVDKPSKNLKKLTSHSL